MTHYPMTEDQRQAFDRDMETVVGDLDGIATLLHACYGDEDPEAWRADEACAAMRRLSWAVERHDQSVRSGALRVMASRPPFVIIGMEALTPAMGCSTIADVMPVIDGLATAERLERSDPSNAS
jgi:hypothetical protein